MGFNEFDEFPLPVPLLDDDLFASLYTADIAAMVVAPDIDKASGSRYEDDDGDDE
jgi:hypothetical protein